MVNRWDDQQLPEPLGCACNCLRRELRALRLHGWWERAQAATTLLTWPADPRLTPHVELVLAMGACWLLHSAGKFPCPMPCSRFSTAG